MGMTAIFAECHDTHVLDSRLPLNKFFAVVV